MYPIFLLSFRLIQILTLVIFDGPTLSQYAQFIRNESSKALLVMNLLGMVTLTEYEIFDEHTYPFIGEVFVLNYLTWLLLDIALVC